MKNLLKLKFRVPMRTILLQTAAVAVFLAVAVSAFTTFVHAQTAATKLNKSQAGFYRMKLGDFEVTALSDGTLPIPVFDVLTNTEPGEVAKLLADVYEKAPLDVSVNAFLIKPAGLPTDRLIMVDTGAGELLGPTVNKLIAAIKAAGYEPEQITDVLITHIHGDHTGGLMNGGKMVFPNAVIHLDKREVEFWLNPANLDKVEESKKEDFKKRFRDAAAMVKPYVDAGKVKTFDGDTQLFPCIRSIAAPGHTPGHSFYAIESKGEKMVFWGDIMHFAQVQFPRPSITITFDVDSKAAAAQRKKAFADAAKNGYWVAPAHVSFPGFGHLRVQGEGYRWIPITYINDAYKVGK